MQPTKKVSFTKVEVAEHDTDSGSDNTPKDKVQAGTTSKVKAILNLKKLDEDFQIPEDWQREREMGKGAYGKVMECTYQPLNMSFAVKRFERIFHDE